MNTSTTQNVTHHSSKSMAILKAVRDYMPILKGKFMFEVTFTIPCIERYQTKYETINANSLVRALSNEKFSIDSMDNRFFWNSTIVGSVYKIFVDQQSPESCVGLTYRLLCFADSPNIDDKFQQGLRQRVNKIYPDATVIFHDVDTLNSISDFEKRFIRTFSHQSSVYLDSVGVMRMENDTRRRFIRLLAADYVVNGCLHKYMRIPYELRHLEGQ